VAFGAADADDTPYPSAFVRALEDHAFGTAAVHRLAPACPTPTPGTLKPFENAARRRVAKAGGSAEDADVAVAEALREALEGGFLAAAFAAEVDGARVASRRMIPATPGTRDETETETETEKNHPACDAATARWLFDAATRPESSRGVALGARDALLAAAGYEPFGLDARQPPRRRRGVFALPVAERSKASRGGILNPGPGGGTEEAREKDEHAPALAWAPTAGEVLEALRRLGVRAPDVGDPLFQFKELVSSTKGQLEKGGKKTKASAGKGKGEKAKASETKTKATRLPGEHRKSVSVNALAADMSISKNISKQDSKDGSFPLSGRSAADKSDAAALVRPPPGPLKPQIVAAVQLLAAWCERDGDGGRRLMYASRIRRAFDARRRRRDAMGI